MKSIRQMYPAAQPILPLGGATAFTFRVSSGGCEDNDDDDDDDVDDDDADGDVALETRRCPARCVPRCVPVTCVQLVEGDQIL